jgi:hypothetical protein
VHFVRNAGDIDVELNIDARLLLPLINLGRVGILDRQVFDILGEGCRLRTLVRFSGAVSGVQ